MVKVMVLSDHTIKEEIAQGRIIIEPLGPSCIQPASVELRLDRKFRVFHEWHYPYQIDLTQPLDGLTELVEIKEHAYFALQSGMFVLGSTMEYIALPDDIMARLEGKSSLGRVGLLVHSTAGYVDPGWQGHLTLELFNISGLPIILHPRMKISQISFHRLTTPADRPYGSPGLGSKYQGQMEPTATRYCQEFDKQSLLSFPSIAVKPISSNETAPKVRRSNAALQEWLKESEFNGSARRFSEALGVPLKTVEEWVYRGVQPSQANKLKVFRLTQLPEFQPNTKPLLADEGEASR